MVTTLTVCSVLLASTAAFDPPPTPPVPVATPEIEPNQTRDTATPAAPAAANLNAFTGICRGFVADPASVATDSRDIWRVTLPANPLVIQRHRLQLTTAGTQGHTGSIMGVQANSGVLDPTSMVALQNTSINTIPARFCQVYTLGASSPSFLYRLTGSSGTTLPYTITLTSETITPTAIRTCPFRAGQIKITTVGRTSLNTKLFLYNADTLAPIEGATNDDTPAVPNGSAASSQSTLTRDLPPGRYLLAIANTDTVDTRLPPADDRASTLTVNYLSESAGMLINGSSTATGDFSFSLTDSSGPNFTVPITAAKPGSFGVVFYKFDTLTWCGPGDIGSAGGHPCWNGVLDNNDFIVFIDAFFDHTSASDLGQTGGVPGADGQWNNNDWIVYLQQFFSGCE